MLQIFITRFFQKNGRKDSVKFWDPWLHRVRFVVTIRAITDNYCISKVSKTELFLSFTYGKSYHAWTYNSIFDFDQCKVMVLSLFTYLLEGFANFDTKTLKA